ncbi:MAG: hypothetical protein AAF499_09145 [Pseudomonadota bacterium]
MARVTTEEIAQPSLPNAAEAQEGIYLYTIGLGVFIGLVLAWVALRGKQWWLLVWSIGLVIAGVVSLIVF